MVISHLSGGFGNQLYSYAFAYAVAKQRGEELVIDTAIQDADWFFRNPDILKMNITYDKRISYKIGRSFIDRAIGNKIRYIANVGLFTHKILEGDIPETESRLKFAINKKGNIYLKGNWSYYEDLEGIADEIKDKFQFIAELSDGAKVIAEDIRKETDSVGIHYRRGDYVRIGIAMKPGFFIEAMKEMKDKLDNPVFYVFSEDKEYVKEQFKDLPYDIRYAEYDSSDPGVEDFRLYSMCKNQIMANSSYSWWGAFLNPNPDKIVIAPTDYDKIWKTRIYPKEWILKPFEMIGKENEGN